MTEGICLGSGHTTAALLCCSALLFPLTSTALGAAGDGQFCLPPPIFFLVTITKPIVLQCLLTCDVVSCDFFSIFFIVMVLNNKDFQIHQLLEMDIIHWFIAVAFFPFFMHRTRRTCSLKQIVWPCPPLPSLVGVVVHGIMQVDALALPWGNITYTDFFVSWYAIQKIGCFPPCSFPSHSSITSSTHDCGHAKNVTWNQPYSRIGIYIFQKIATLFWLDECVK